MKNINKTIIITMVIMTVVLFPFSTMGQGTCNLGLDSITVNPGNVSQQSWEISGSEIHGVKTLADKSGYATHIGFIIGSTSTSIKAGLYGDEENAPSTLMATSNILSAPFGIQAGQVDTVYALLTTSPEVVYGNYYWPCGKHAADNLYNLIFNDLSVGTRFEVGNPYANGLPLDLTGVPGVLVAPGCYGIFLVIEDCIAPVFGCMDAGACNFDPLANVSQGCEYESCVGCMDEGACNFDPQALIDGGCVYLNNPYRDCQNTCWNDVDSDNICDEEEIPGCMDVSACNYAPLATDNIGCVYSGYDKNGDGSINIADIIIILGYFEQVDPCINIVGNNIIETNDLLTLLPLLE